MATIALLHLDLEPGALAANRAAVEAGCRRAAEAGADLIVTPELAVSGYGFHERIGGDWIAEGQTERLRWAAGLAQASGAHLLLGAPEYDEVSGQSHNTLFAIDRDGEIIGWHRKINCLGVGAEAWSSPGSVPTVVELRGVGRVGLFVCADMYSERLVRETPAAGAELLLSAANWAPGENGPDGVWERASELAPVLVCNRTGFDVLDFGGAESVAAMGGERIASLSAPTSAMALVEWDAAARRLQDWRAVDLR